jgi:phosphoribosyl-AMP cyclohydrolase
MSMAETPRPCDISRELHYDEAGLVPVVLQDAETLEVLIVAHMNLEALRRTRETGLVHLWSRSRGALWLKGETSGRLQHVVEIRPNCELSSLLVLVRQALPGSCHTGHASCYYRRATDAGLEEVAPPLFDPRDVYGDGARADLRRLLAAYAWLRDRPVIPESGTSRLLHGDGPDPRERVRQEWEELLGVLDGTHRHTGFAEDAALEAYQVLYWTCLAQVASGAVDADRSWNLLRLGRAEDRDPRAVLAGAEAVQEPAAVLDALWTALGAACGAAGLDPATVIRRDLAELGSRPYMAPFFAPSPQR